MADREITISEAGPREVCLRVGGTWRMRDGVSPDAHVIASIAERHPSRLFFDGGGLVGWDSSLVTFVRELAARLGEQGVAVESGGLPDGVQRLLALASTRPERTGARGAAASKPWLVEVGDAVVRGMHRFWSELGFLGEVTTALGRFVARRARARGRDIFREVKAAGAQALPIITLTSLLLGMIMAFVGAAALRPFGAGIYVANVVSVAMLRELSAVLTAIVMAGRTGSAYAAQLATMNLTQELDALTTMGIGAVDFLVLPRTIALSLMLPLLCVYANFVGIFGGAVVAVGMLDLTPAQYLHQTRLAVSLDTFFIGVGKSLAFGVLVAYLGCRAGLRTGRSAASVGDAATSAMVTAILSIIVADGIFAVVFQVLGI